MKFYSLFLVVSLLITPVYSQSTKFVLPEVELLGAESPVDYGEMIILKANLKSQTLPEHLSSIKYQWTVLENGQPKTNIMVWPDGTQVFFTSGKKPKDNTKRRFTVILDVDCLFEVKDSLKVSDANGKLIDSAKVTTSKGQTVDSVITESKVDSPNLIAKEIIVGETDPTPEPQPNPTPTPPPTPTPTPDLPQGTFGLAKLSRDLALNNVVGEGRSKANALGDAYDSVVKKINQSITKKAAGVALTAEDQALDVPSIMKSISQANKLALGDSAQSWQQWDKLYGDAIYDLYTKKKINTPNDWSTAFAETALGLKSVK